MKLFRRMLLSPAVLGFVYVFVLIPMFALWYDSLPARSFVDSAIKRESPVAGDAARLRDALTISLRTSSSPSIVAFNDYLGPAQFDRGLVRAEKIKVMDDGRLLVELRGQYESLPSDSKRREGTFGVWVEVLISEGKTAETSPGGDTRIGYAVSRSSPAGATTTSASSLGPSVSSLFGVDSTAGGSGSQDAALFMMPVDTFNRLNRFFNATSGDPSQASRSLYRMGYFSVTTITTLGFGDIAPVSERARLIISIEAIAGVVTVGLFVNAVATRGAGGVGLRTTSRVGNPERAPESHKRKQR